MVFCPWTGAFVQNLLRKTYTVSTRKQKTLTVLPNKLQIKALGCSNV